VQEAVECVYSVKERKGEREEKKGEEKKGEERVCVEIEKEGLF